jgi:hypothetical protein
MRAHTITSTSRPRPKAWLSVIALVLAGCALVVPSTAGAQYSSAFSSTGGSSESSQPIGAGDYSSVNSILGAERTPGTAEFQSVPSKAGPLGRNRPATGTPYNPSQDADSGYSSVSSLAGPLPSEPTLVSGSPASTDDEFDWLSAAIGAAAAMALGALGGAAFLTVRRRTAVSPSTASMS